MHQRYNSHPPASLAHALGCMRACIRGGGLRQLRMLGRASPPGPFLAASCSLPHPTPPLPPHAIHAKGKRHWPKSSAAKALDPWGAAWPRAPPPLSDLRRTIRCASHAQPPVHRCCCRRWPHPRLQACKPDQTSCLTVHCCDTRYGSARRSMHNAIQEGGKTMQGSGAGAACRCQVAVLSVPEQQQRQRHTAHLPSTQQQRCPGSRIGRS